MNLIDGEWRDPMSKHLGDKGKVRILIVVKRQDYKCCIIAMAFYVASCSGGKDSVAQLILGHEHGERIDAAIFAEVMFDKRKGWTGISPIQMQFIRETLKPKIESWGIPFYIVHSDRDYLDIFHHKVRGARKYPEHEGMTYGFPGGKGTCAIKRDCKLRAINMFYRTIKDRDVYSYVGIAADEGKRLSGLYSDPKAISLLAKYGVSEEQAYHLCKEYGLLSPVYGNRNTYHEAKAQKRDGCWFCNFAKDCEHCVIKEQMPEAWNAYVALEEEKPLVYSRWNPYSTETLHERSIRLESK